MEFETVEPTAVDGDLVSSSRIRSMPGQGPAPWRPNRLLSPALPAFAGSSTHGRGRGGGLGFPTANLDAIDTLIPADGVCARARLHRWPGGRAPLGDAHRPERHLRRARPQGRVPPHRLRRRPLRQDRRTRLPLTPPTVPQVRRARRPARTDPDGRRRGEGGLQETAVDRRRLRVKSNSRPSPFQGTTAGRRRNAFGSGTGFDPGRQALDPEGELLEDGLDGRIRRRRGGGGRGGSQSPARRSPPGKGPRASR